MPIYELTKDAVVELPDARFGDYGVRERDDLQRLLRDQFDVIDPGVLIVAEEFAEWDRSKRRIDLLGVDRDANLVVIELKRDETGGHMELQAVRYAAMVSNMTFEQVVDVYQGHLHARGVGGDAEARLLEFLSWASADEQPFGQDVRVVLISAEFSKEVMTSVLWLNERDLDIRCVRLRPQGDGTRLFLEIQQIVPLPEASEYLVGVRQKSAETRAASKGGAWTGEWYVNLGMDSAADPPRLDDGRPYWRHWEWSRKFGYVAAGGGETYSRPLRKLEGGDPVYVYQRGAGYVGFGHVTYEATPLHEAKLPDGRPLTEEVGLPDRNRPDADPVKWDYAVGVEWVKTVPLDAAEAFAGVFANQNVVCKLRNERTLRFLRDRFGGGDDA